MASILCALTKGVRKIDEVLWLNITHPQPAHPLPEHQDPDQLQNPTLAALSQ